MALPKGWWEEHAPALLRAAPGIADTVARVARDVNVDPRLLITRMQLEQSAITYAWDGSDGTYPGGDADKLRYLCGVDRTDSGDREGGWFGVEAQVLGCALRFKHWYRGEDGPRDGWENWLGLQEDPRYQAGMPVTRGGETITPANQASADCLRYTTSMPAQRHLREIGRRWFQEDYDAEESGDMSAIRQVSVEAAISELEEARAGGAILYATFGHHTVQPNASNFNGMVSMRGIENYHVTQCDGYMIFCHFYAGSDGHIYTGRSVFSNNCACQAPPDSFKYDMLPESLRLLMAAKGAGTPWREWPNKYGGSVEIVGNFDREEPRKSLAFSNGLDLIAAMHRIWQIPIEHAYFHRDVSFKTCPGKLVDRDWYRSELRRRLEASETDYDEWAAPAIERVREAEIMVGYGDGTFRGREPVTRQQLAQVGANLLDYIDAGKGEA